MVLRFVASLTTRTARVQTRSFVASPMRPLLGCQTFDTLPAQARQLSAIPGSAFEPRHGYRLALRVPAFEAVSSGIAHAGFALLHGREPDPDHTYLKTKSLLTQGERRSRSGNTRALHSGSSTPSFRKPCRVKIKVNSKTGAGPEQNAALSLKRTARFQQARVKTKTSASLKTHTPAPGGTQPV